MSKNSRILCSKKYGEKIELWSSAGDLVMLSADPEKLAQAIIDADGFANEYLDYCGDSLDDLWSLVMSALRTRKLNGERWY